MKYLILASVLFLSACGALTGPDRYSDDPAAARIQHLTDFCIGYGSLRDAATAFLKVDVERANPVTPVDAVLAYRDARAFIKPYCDPDFDPQGEAFSLEALNEQLLAIRLILLKREES